MKRFDLRNYKDNFLKNLNEVIDNKLNMGEVGLFLFEMGDFSNVTKAIELIKQKQFILMNSLRFNEVDWTIVVKKEYMESSSAKSVDATESTIDNFQESITDLQNQHKE